MGPTAAGTPQAALATAAGPKRPWRLAVACLSLCLSLAPPASAAAPTRLVLLPVAAPGAAKLEGPAGRLLARPLGRQHTVLGPAALLRTARRAGLRSPSWRTPEAALRAARAARASHILWLRSSADRDLRSTQRQPRQVYAARATLIEVASGRTLFTRRYAMARASFTAALAATILQDVRPLLPAGGRRSPAAAPLAQREPPPAPPLEPLPLAPTDGAAAGVDPYTQPYTGPGPASQAAAAEPAVPGDIPFGSSSIPEQAKPHATEVPQLEEPLPLVDRRRYRRPVRLWLGPHAFVRSGQIVSPAGGNPPYYGARPGRKPPIFTQVVLQAELYPLGFGGDGSWWEGLGLHLEGNLGAARTSLGGGRITTSPLGGAFAGGHYRWVLANSRRSPDLQLRLGGSTFSFPLQGLPFPGVGYRSYYAGLSLQVPVVLDLLSLTLGGHYLPRVVGFGGTKHLGLQLQAGWGYHAEAGLRVVLVDNLLLTALASVDRTSLPYAGPTNLTDSAQQYTNVRLTDLMWGATLGVGLVF